VSRWTVSCGLTVTPERCQGVRLSHARSASRAPLADVWTCHDNCVQYRRDTDRLLQFSTVRCTSSDVWCISACSKHSCPCGYTRVPDAAALSRCLIRYTGYPCVSVLMASICFKARSYRPISNLSVLSKSLERLVSQQLVAYLRENDLLPDRHIIR